MTMRAITTRQPHAGLIVMANKVENRRESTPYRGEIAIHAAKTLDHEAMLQVEHEGIAGPFTVLGAVLAVADLVDIHQADQDSQTTCCQPYGARRWGRSAAQHLVFANVRLLPTPVPCRGQLWVGWPLPEDVEHAVRNQLTAEEANR